MVEASVSPLVAEGRERGGAIVAVCPPEVIDGPIVGDRHQPGAQRAARRVKKLGAVPQRQERLLDHLGGDPPIPASPCGRGEHGRAVPVIEAGEGILGPLASIERGAASGMASLTDSKTGSGRDGRGATVSP